MMPAGASPSSETCGRCSGNAAAAPVSSDGFQIGAGLGNSVVGDHGHGFGVSQDVGQFALAIEDVDWNEDHAELDASQIQVNHLDAVGEVDAEAIAGLKPALGQQLGQPIAACVDVAEGVG